MKKITAVLILLLILSGTAIFIWNRQSVGQEKTQPFVTSSPKSEATLSANLVVPKDWKTYTNRQLGFSFAIPNNFIIEANGQHSVMARHPDSQSKVGNVEFFYVSVLPQNLRDNESGEVYNYRKTFQQKLLGMKVGEIKNLSENEGQKDWFMYERAGDVTINANVAKVFINQRPWEFPNGFWEYRYIFELTNITVIAGGYFMGGPSDTPLSLPIFQQVMNSLQITDSM